MVRPLSILSVAALAASAATAQTVPYKAVGTEPFWALTIEGRTMRLEEPGRRPTVVARPVARPSFNGERYVTRTMTVDVTHARCSDGMSDRTYRDTVTVQVGRRTLKGCGGATSEQRSTLTNTRWTVWQVNGRAIRAERPLTINFAVDRIEGKLCNGFGGKYALSGDRLRVDDVVATRMACQGPAQLAETTLFTMWRAPVRATVSRWGTLTLAGGRDTVTLRPAR
jgi:heat shock protein HslJ